MKMRIDTVQHFGEPAGVGVGFGVGVGVSVGVGVGVDKNLYKFPTCYDWPIEAGWRLGSVTR